MLTPDGYGMTERLKRVSSETEFTLPAVPVNKVSSHCEFMLIAVSFHGVAGVVGLKATAPRLNKPDNTGRPPVFFSCRLLVTFAILQISHTDTGGCD
jgi:hypothetical protein